MAEITDRYEGVTHEVLDETVESLRELLTLDELTNRVGLSVRNIRFYTTKGLVPPPIRRGRSGYYSADHVARLELVQELQSHGFTLSAHTMTDSRASDTGSREADVSHLDDELAELVRRFLQP